MEVRLRNGLVLTVKLLSRAEASIFQMSTSGSQWIRCFFSMFSRREIMSTSRNVSFTSCVSILNSIASCGYTQNGRREQGMR
ncbi:hypothetical protein O9929_05445 [Vibrio lentus]|nr:hypothetical protein [Vibrio lentus]